MTNVGYNSPQYGYGTQIPPQPVPPQPVPAPDNRADDDSPAPAVASYDVDPSSGQAPPLVVPPEAPVTPAEPPVGGQPLTLDRDDEPEADEPGAAEPAAAASSGRVAVQVVDRMRSTAERGTTTVPTHVIEKIATLAVREVPGVYEFATGEEKPLAIELDAKTATIEMHLVIEYGFAVHSVTEKVRTKVISALENLFSLDVTAVDIVIDDIHLEDAEPTAE
jgi:uncharacterized alkaline shock family protein YloU